MDFLLVLGAYLIGSLSFGMIAGSLRGIDLAQRDVPGASGTFRQLGPAWGAFVAVADILKGVGVGYLTPFTNNPLTFVLMGAAVVAGHIWPVFFGFRGGGGIAPTLGFFLWLHPGLTLLVTGIALAVAGLYWQLYWVRNRQSWYPIPVGAVVAYLFALFVLWGQPSFWAFLAMSVLVAVRGLGMTRKG
ncbi:MAG TPA: glycerol-3-phosphate acyltransferase [Meiothermus sp.]|nr:glycerol-3-phosphate acyltransferase [Meiothermus sp.]